MAKACLHNDEAIIIRKITPCKGVDGEHVNEHVVVCFDDKLRLLTVGGHPHLPQHILEGDVAIGVKETALEQ